MTSGTNTLELVWDAQSQWHRPLSREMPWRLRGRPPLRERPHERMLPDETREWDVLTNEYVKVARYEG